MIRLIASDMDGTLLDERSKVPPETFELIDGLYEQGVRFCVSSGRPYQFLADVFAPVADRMDFVCSNGCHTVIEGKTVDRELFSYQDVMALARLCEDFDNLHVIVRDVDDHAFLLDPPVKALHYTRTLAELWNDFPTPVTPLPTTNNLTGFVADDRGQNVMDSAYVLTLEMGDRFTFSPTDNYSIDFMPHDVNKGTAIQVVMDHYGISPDEVVAYGDSMNDYDILRLVGYPTAMSNALYAPKQAARRVIESNREHGVQKDMRRLLEELWAGGDGSATMRFGAR